MINKIEEALNFRHACKIFNDKKIPKQEIELILESARLSPSSFGLEPWKFIVIENKELREKLNPVCWGANGSVTKLKGQLLTSSHFVIIVSKKANTLKHDSTEIRDFLENVKKLPSDFIDNYLSFIKSFQENGLDTDVKIENWANKQTYIPLANMMHTAALLGIDSCPIEGFDKDSVHNILNTENILDTDKYSCSLMLALGYRVDEPKREKTRQANQDVINWVK